MVAFLLSPAPTFVTGQIDLRRRRHHGAPELLPLQGTLPVAHTFVRESSRGTVRRACRLTAVCGETSLPLNGQRAGACRPIAGRGAVAQGLGYSSVVLDRLARHACAVLGFEKAWVSVRAAGDPGDFIVVAGAGTDPDLIGQRQHAAGLGAVAAAPFLAGVEERGALCVGGRDEQRKLESPEMELLCELGMLAGEALSHHENGELTAGDSQAEIRALVKALAEVDGDTYHHSLEVAATATVVGERLGLTRAELVEVELGALLHDVGKLRLPRTSSASRAASARTNAAWCGCTRSGAPRWSGAFPASRPWP